MDLKLINALGLPHYYTWQQVDKRLFELLAYVGRVELAIEAGYQMCDGKEYEKFITAWTSCNYRPKWLPESLHSVSE